MKRITLCLLMVLLGVYTASARQINPDEALSVASDFMSSSELKSSKATNSALQPMKAPGVNENVAVNPYYIFNRGDNEGFVIISGDDRIPKILGYSDKGSFDARNLPPQLKAMMEQWAARIAKLPDSAPKHVSWSKAPAAIAGEGVLMETANWGQGYPYNEKVPIMNGERCMTGCVATAMAIVMKYNKWPESFNWDSMPMNTDNDPVDYNASYSAIAELMASVGEAVKMDYSPWESGAHMNWVGHKMQQEFSYSPSCQYIKSENFTNEEWMTLLHSNLDNGQPVIYNGLDEEITMNHAFIIDGYNSLGYHVNWGWDGACNGYYAIDGLTPNDVQDFSYLTGMVVDITPDRSGNEYSRCFIDNGYFWGDGESGNKMNISVAEIVKGDKFDVIWDNIHFQEGFYGEIGLAITDKEGKIKEVLKTVPVQSLYGLDKTKLLFQGIITTVDLNISDRLQIVSKDRDDKDYKIVLGTIEYPSYCSISGNNPRYDRITINVGENVYFDFSDNSVNCGVLPQGENVLSVMEGLGVIYRVCSLEDDRTERPVVVKVEGKLRYGTIHTSSFEEYDNSFDVASECRINAYLVDLQDRELNINEAGSLKEFISLEEAPCIRNLTINGKMNAYDFWYIRNNMPSIQNLDLSKVSIVGVTASDNQFILTPTEYMDDYIPEWALTNLHGSNITDLLLPENLKGIYSDALVNFKISSITIPKNVEYIGKNVFYANTKLSVVEVLNPEPIGITDCIFTSTRCPENGILYVPEGSADKYRQIPVWQDFKEIREGSMPVFVKEIKLSVNDWSGKVGQTFKIDTTLILPENASDKSVVWSSADESVAKVDSEGNVTAMDLGQTVITASASDGGGAFSECFVYIDQKPGDSNGDGIINISDAVNAANAIVGLPTSDFDYSNADMNEDGYITVSDVTSIIALIPSQKYNLNVPDERKSAPIQSSGYLVSSSSIDGSVELSLSSDESIAAIQFDLCLPEEVAVPEIVLSEGVSSNHSIQKFLIDGNKLRVVLYSASGKLLPNVAEATVLTIKGGSIEDALLFENVFASDACGGSMILGVENLGISNGVSGSSIKQAKVTPLIGKVHVSGANGSSVAVYSLDGSCLGTHSAVSDEFEMPLDAGIYIVKVGNSAYRVIIK